MSGSVSSPLGQINLRSSLCGAAHMELNATCCEGANRTNAVLWLLLYRHYCCQLHKGNQNQHRWQKRTVPWFPALKLIHLTRNQLSERDPAQLNPRCCLTYLFVSRLFGDDLTSTLEPEPLESIRKCVFRAFSPRAHYPVLHMSTHQNTPIKD